MTPDLQRLLDLAEQLGNEDWRTEQLKPEYAERFLPHRVVEVKETEDVRGMPDGEDGHIYIAQACGFGATIGTRAAYIAAANPAIISALVRELIAAREALEKIADGYVGDNAHDCPGCDFGPEQEPEHDEGCVYLIARAALPQTKAGG